jgi:flavin reductase (DIM6/NTAB) family NADH-FMN oxidoreductase RutF
LKHHNAFEALIGHFDGQMLIATTVADEERSGCLVGFATQCSIDPARFLVCISKANHTYRVTTRGASTFVIHVLRPSDHAMARHFGEQTGDEVDKFANIAWEDGPFGVPVVSGLDWFAGVVRERVDLGDHVGFVLDVLNEGSAERFDEGRLGLSAAATFDPGHPA